MVGQQEGRMMSDAAAATIVFSFFIVCATFAACFIAWLAMKDDE